MYFFTKAANVRVLALPLHGHEASKGKANLNIGPRHLLRQQTI